MSDQVYVNTISRNQWVRILADYGCEGVWNREGAACCVEDLPVSEALRQRILKWQELYEEYDVHDYPKTFDMEAFGAAGRELAIAVKTELPNWTVIYFDESKLFKEVPESEKEYEIVLTESRE